MIQLISLVLSLVIASQAMAANKPNILFIFADDWGWGDLGCLLKAKSLLAANITGRKNGHVQDIIGRRCGRTDLDRLIHTRKDRANNRRIAHFLHQLD